MKPKKERRILTVASGELTIAEIEATISGLTHAKRLKDFKPRRLNPKERKFLRQIGTRKELEFKERPSFILKTVTDDQCDLCAQPLADLAICIRCYNCVFCGAKSHDPHSQRCLDCGNHLDHRSDETDVVLQLNR